MRRRLISARFFRVLNLLFHDLTEFVRKEFLSREEKFLATTDELKNELPSKEIEEIKEYLEHFFTILKDDDSFEREVVSRCREL